MGTVYRATDTTLRRAVALKVLEQASALPPKEAVARFLREGRAAASVIHPNVVRVFDVGEEDGRLYLAMELVDGTTLRARMAEGSPSFATRVRWLVEIARGLSAAHDRGLVHRDVKPENVLIDATGTAKLTDFGIAKRPSDGPASFRTRTGNLLGTPEYMAPEQCATSDVDARADQYSWGLIANELLGRGIPSERVPKEVKACIAQASAKEPEERYPSMDAIIEVLEPWSKEIERTTIEEKPSTQAADAPPKRGTQVFVLALALTVVVASLAAIIVLLARTKRPADAESVDAQHEPVVASAAPPPTLTADEVVEPVESAAPPASTSAARRASLTAHPPVERVGNPRVSVAVDEVGCIGTTTPAGTKTVVDMEAKAVFASEKIVHCFESRLQNAEPMMSIPARLTFRIGPKGIVSITPNSVRTAASACIESIARRTSTARLRRCPEEIHVVISYTFRCNCVHVENVTPNDVTHPYCKKAICD